MIQEDTGGGCHFSDNGKSIISYFAGEGYDKPFLYFTKKTTWIDNITLLMILCHIMDSSGQMPLNILLRKCWGSFGILMVGRGGEPAASKDGQRSWGSSSWAAQKHLALAPGQQLLGCTKMLMCPLGHVFETPVINSVGPILAPVQSIKRLATFTCVHWFFHVIRSCYLQKGLFHASAEYTKSRGEIPVVIWTRL